MKSTVSIQVLAACAMIPSNGPRISGQGSAAIFPPVLLWLQIEVHLTNCSDPKEASEMPWRLLIDVPVNHAIRFSDPVTALTARRIQHGQPDPSPGIKTHSSPAAFPTTLSVPSPPGRASGRGELYLLPTPPGRPIRRGQWENPRSATTWLLFARRLGSTVSPTDPPYVGPCLNP
jgi:hypothetical protein